MKKIALLAVLAVAGVGLLAGCESDSVGISTKSSVIQGGSVYTATVYVATTTLTAAQVCDSGVISITPGRKKATNGIQFPTAASIGQRCLTKDGMSKMFLFENAATTTKTVYLEANTNVTVLSDDANGDYLAQNAWAEVQLTRVRSDEYTAVIRPFMDAD